MNDPIKVRVNPRINQKRQFLAKANGDKGGREKERKKFLVETDVESVSYNNIHQPDY